MKKTKNLNSIILKSFIVIAVLRKNAFCIFPKMLGICFGKFHNMLMMLLSVMQCEERKVNETTITYNGS
ncbi:MAG: hypothetical protein COS08_03125 [Euryarchaeota archaeon CG01_land_8_20_14_3_00_38_12]|nr:MAG: hypothetical protein COS08_03125 [Euryarchaeota archaeon CG01_land_8_20_14_3_00_38_12]PJB21875.1 MAG: hypothetical protein CO114_03065 [Euryarchaeota archaeon CG_4_9_14_3_um_filter_38_12]